MAMSATCPPSWRSRATLSSAAMPETPWATRSTKPGFSCADRSSPLVRIASRKRCAPNISRSCAICLKRAAAMQSPRNSGATDRLANSTPSTSTTRIEESMTVKDVKDDGPPRTVPLQSATFSNPVNAEIRRAAATGIYDIRGGGAKRRVPHFDDLLFLGASVSRYPLEGYRERCDTKVTLGTRFAKNPIELDIPITIAGMSFGALSGRAKEALGRGASEAGTSTTTGDGGMTPEERGHSTKLVYQYLPSRYGMNPDDLRKPTRSRLSWAKAPSPA